MGNPKLNWDKVEVLFKGQLLRLTVGESVKLREALLEAELAALDRKPTKT